MPPRAPEPLSYLPLAIKVSAQYLADLQKILASPLVRSVVLDRDYDIEPLRNESLPLIRQPEVAASLGGGDERCRSGYGIGL